MEPRHRPTADEGVRALREHVAERAEQARSRHGALLDRAALERLLEDPEVVRFPTVLRFEAEPLLPGEFAWAAAFGARPQDGFALIVHPSLRDRPRDLVLAAVYHLVAINYPEVATSEEAELFGSTLLELDREEYYSRLCALADEFAPQPIACVPAGSGGCPGCSCQEPVAAGREPPPAPGVLGSS
jgi:hypothetical protein